MVSIARSRPKDVAAVPPVPPPPRPEPEEDAVVVVVPPAAAAAADEAPPEDRPRSPLITILSVSRVYFSSTPLRCLTASFRSARCSGFVVHSRCLPLVLFVRASTRPRGVSIDVGVFRAGLLYLCNPESINRLSRLDVGTVTRTLGDFS
jgi:hypothetical protein